jgi:hypothetical protein
MNDRNHQLAAAMIDPGERRIGGIKLRPFSYGSMQLAYLFKLSLFTGEGETEPSEAEKQRQIVTFAWMQSAPLDEVVSAVHDGSAENRVLRFSLGITFDTIPELMAEINRIGEMVSASNVRVESKHPSGEDDAPGKS